MSEPINHQILQAAFLAGRADAADIQEDSQAMKDLETTLEMVLGHANVLTLAKIAKRLWREKVK